MTQSKYLQITQPPVITKMDSKRYSF